MKNYLLICSLEHFIESKKTKKTASLSSLLELGKGKVKIMNDDDDLITTTENGKQFIWIKLSRLAELFQMTEGDFLSRDFMLSDKFMDVMNKQAIFPLRKIKVPTTKLND